MTWQMFPVVVTVTKDGCHRLPASESADYAQQVVDGAADSARRAARPTAFRQPGSSAVNLGVGPGARPGLPRQRPECPAPAPRSGAALI